MTDQYTPSKTVITPEIGGLLRLFRLLKDVQAKKISDNLKKSPAYVTKLEQGLIKRIETDTFTNICNCISDSENGVWDFISTAKELMDSPNTNVDGSKFAIDTQTSLRNINDCVLSRYVSKDLREFIVDYLTVHGVSVSALSKEINNNDSLSTLPNYDNIPENQWVAIDSSKIPFEHEFKIKRNIHVDYISAILSGSQATTHRYIMESILDTAALLTSLEGLLEGLQAHDILNRNGFPSISFFRKGAITSDNITDVDRFDPDVKPKILDIISSLKILSVKNADKCIPGLSRLSHNLINDLGFTYAYLNTDLSPLKEKSREQKQSFLNEVRELVKKYSDQASDIETYE